MRWLTSFFPPLPGGRLQCLHALITQLGADGVIKLGHVGTFHGQRLPQGSLAALHQLRHQGRPAQNTHSKWTPKHHKVHFLCRGKNSHTVHFQTSLPNMAEWNSCPHTPWQTHLMCLTQLELTRSATNSTVRLRDGGWLWKNACSNSIWEKERSRHRTHSRSFGKLHVPSCLRGDWLEVMYSNSQKCFLYFYYFLHCRLILKTFKPRKNTYGMMY